MRLVAGVGALSARRWGLTRSKKLTMGTKFYELFASAGSASCQTIKKRTIRASVVTPSY